MVEKLLSDFFEECKIPSTSEDIIKPKNIFFKSSFQNLQQYMMRDTEDNPIILKAISNALKDMDLLKACCAAYLCGCLVPELGAKEEGIPIVDLFAKVIPLVHKYILFRIELKEKQPDLKPAESFSVLFQSVPDALKAYVGCEWLTLAIMEVITKESNCRMRLREYHLFEDIKPLQKIIKNIDYIIASYYACPKLPLILLSPETEQAMTAEANDITNNFHLITLIEAELSRMGLSDAYQLKDYQFDDNIYQYATGTSIPNSTCSISAHQQYYTLKFLQDDTSSQEENISDFYRNALLWGEDIPENIPRFEGNAVIVMDSKNMFAGRTWDINFILKCHDNLNPYLKLTGELPKEEVKRILKACRHFH